MMTLVIVSESFEPEAVRTEYKGMLRDMWSAWVAAQPVGGAQPVEECVVM